MFIIICFSLFFLLVSDILGVIINAKFLQRKWRFFYSLPLGVLLNIGILQCFYYPLQLIDTSIKWFVLITGIWFSVILILGVLNFNLIHENVKKMSHVKIQIFFSLFVFIIFILIYYYVEFPRRTDDLYFYIPYVIQKATTSLRTSGSILYDYQGFYDLLAVFVYSVNKICDLLNLSKVLPIAIISWIPAIILYTIIPLSLLNLYHRLKPYFNKKIIIYAIVMIVIYICSMYWFFQTPYIGNTYRRITLILIFELLYILVNSNSNKVALVLSLMMISIISQTSTGFIFSSILIYAFLCYYGLNKKQDYLQKTFIIAIGPAIYLAIFYPITIPLVVLLYIVFFISMYFKFYIKLEKFWNLICKYVVVILPLLFATVVYFPFYNFTNTYSMNYFVIENFSFFDPHKFEGIVNLLDFKIDTFDGIVKSIFNLIAWIFIGHETIYCLKHNNLKLFGILNVIIFTTFFNPFVMNFVIDNITGIVYFRLYDLFFNFVTILFGIVLLFGIIRNPYLKFSMILTLSIGILFEIPKNQTWYSMNYSNDFASHLNHANSLDVSVINELMDYAEEENNPTPIIASQIYSSGALTDRVLINVKDNIYKYELSDDSDEATLQRILYRNEPGLPEIREDYLKACTLLRDKKVQYTVIDAQYNWELESGIGYCGEKIFEKENYRIFKMHYDWLQWSMPEEYVNEE